ncbi:hypothetical protein B5M43_011950 [Microbacterium sp. MEC084]|uniref:hypothetical protein n=1 Tax=Microbacterium sp. MEC084 TaxID=1963027 RepID=UPI001101AFFA|nr:hypothetical protein [Microbacterium sp. MEC084]MCD1269537.1 hypothetical protein [Microbacterium sp. MEC084]
MADRHGPARRGAAGVLRRVRQALAGVWRALVRRDPPARVGAGPGPAAPRGAPPDDPHLAGTDPDIAAYVAARDPEWFAFEAGDPAAAEPAAGPGPGPGARVRGETERTEAHGRVAVTHVDPPARPRAPGAPAAPAPATASAAGESPAEPSGAPHVAFRAATPTAAPPPSAPEHAPSSPAAARPAGVRVEQRVRREPRTVPFPEPGATNRVLSGPAPLPAVPQDGPETPQRASDDRMTPASPRPTPPETRSREQRPGEPATSPSPASERHPFPVLDAAPGASSAPRALPRRADRPDSGPEAEAGARGRGAYAGVGAAPWPELPPRPADRSPRDGALADHAAGWAAQWGWAGDASADPLVAEQRRT